MTANWKSERLSRTTAFGRTRTARARELHFVRGVDNAAKDAFDFLGSPEGELAISQAVIYVESAPKSNAAY